MWNKMLDLSTDKVHVNGHRKEIEGWRLEREPFVRAKKRGVALMKGLRSKAFNLFMVANSPCYQISWYIVNPKFWAQSTWLSVEYGTQTIETWCLWVLGLALLCCEMQWTWHYSTLFICGLTLWFFFQLFSQFDAEGEGFADVETFLEVLYKHISWAYTGRTFVLL